MPKIRVGFLLLLILLFLPQVVSAQSREKDMAVTAVVPAQPTDFQNSIASTDGSGPFTPNTTLTYTITYGSNLQTNSSFTLEADWTQGTIDGNGSPSVEILDYVVGSATSGYGGVNSVIDTVNRKITWDFTNFPAQTTDQTVTFKLKTNSAYSGNKKVTFTVSSTLTGPGVTVGPETITQSLQIPTTPTSPPTTSTPTTGTPTPTSASVSPNPIITHISVQTISNTKATIAVSTSVPTTLTLSYGLSPGNLTNTLKDVTLLTDHVLELAPLTPNTRYYFRITVRGENGRFATSDIFTFQTAKEGQVSFFQPASFVLTSSNVILINNPQATSYKDLTGVIPQGLIYEFRFKLANSGTFPKVSVFLRDQHVLGIRAFAQDINTQSTTLVPFSDGTYHGQLTAPYTPGENILVARIEDTNGAITESSLAILTIVPQLRVVQKDSQAPIDHAQVTVFFLDPQTGSYELLSAQLFPIDNPSYTSGAGFVPFVLPKGSYKLAVSAPGYKSKEAHITIDPSDTHPYPTIELEHQIISVSGIAGQYGSSIGDLTSLSLDFFDRIFSSPRFFELLTVFNILLFLLVTALSLSLRLKVPLWYLPFFMSHRSRNEKNIYTGKVIDEKTRTPIGNASVYIVNVSTKKIISHIHTNTGGVFKIQASNEHLGFFVVKEGYEAGDTRDIQTAPLLITLSNRVTPTRSLLHISEDLLGLSFEVLLIGSFIFEIFFLSNFGIFKTLPFIIISLFTLGVWTLFMFEIMPKMR